MTTILPTDQPIRYCVTGLDEPIVGETPVGNLTGVNGALSVIADADENAFVAALPAASFPELPPAGWLDADDIYQYEGQAVIVRQSHFRTIYAPSETPALFIVWREDADAVLEWVVGERVDVGTRRSYDGVVYRCIQAHVIDDPGWTPPATLGVLWKVVVVEPVTLEWKAGTAYKIGDRVTYAGLLYECRQAHTAIVTWEPPKVLALWLPV